MMYAGIDAGSRAIKVVVIDKDNNIVASGKTDQGINQDILAEKLLNEVLEQGNIKRTDISKIIATGYGRDAIEFADKTITEITCHAAGVSHLTPSARTVIDIGGQDSKVLRLEESGRVHDFMMNDRCAAGTGRFLEVVASRLNVDINDLGELVSRSNNPSSISSMCVVFAETEIIGLLASGETPENIAAGVQLSIATRITSMAGRNVVDPVVFTGGVALVPGMNKALEASISHEVEISPNPQFTGALGAAILASKETIW